MNTREINKININDPITIVILTIIAIFIVVFIVFFAFIFYYSNSTSKRFGKSENAIKEIWIDVKEKKVHVKEISFKNKSENDNVYELDDFIYMISLNPDSIAFRELLKLINNNATKLQIEKKIKQIPKRVAFIFHHLKGSPSFTICHFPASGISPKEDIHLQLIQSRISNNVIKEKIPNYLTETLIPLSDKELFTSVHKELKNINGKNWNLLYLKSEKINIHSSKSIILNNFKLSLIKYHLKEEGINSFTSNDGGIYVLAKGNGDTSNSRLYRYWRNRLSAMSLAVKKKYNIDLELSDYKVIALSGTGKTLEELSRVFIKSRLISRGGKGNKYKFLDKESSEINTQYLDLLKSFKAKNFPIIKSSTKIQNRGYKNQISYLVDITYDSFSNIMKYACYDKSTFLKEIINYANKQASRHKDDINVLVLNINYLRDIEEALRDIKLKKNMYIGFRIGQGIFYDARDVLNIIRRNGNDNFVQFVLNNNDASVDLLKLLDPSFVILSPQFGTNKQDLDNSNEKKIIEQNLGKATKLLILG